MTIDPLILELYQKNMIKFGDFTLKSGKKSVVYLNLREMIAYPVLFKTISDRIFSQLPANIHPELICGVPYSALVLASYLSAKHNIPMLLRRKEAKAYGTKQQIEGVFQPGQSCILIEDVVTTGISILETAKDLLSQGIKITDVLSLINREEGGVENLAKEGITLHAVFTLKEILQALDQAGKIERHYHEALGL